MASSPLTVSILISPNVGPALRGLRPQPVRPCFFRAGTSERRPRVEGIETHAASRHVVHQTRSERRPRVEGIETGEFPRAGLHVVQSPNVGPALRGLRLGVITPLWCRQAPSERRPRVEGIET